MLITETGFIFGLKRTSTALLNWLWVIEDSVIVDYHDMHNMHLQLQMKIRRKNLVLSVQSTEVVEYADCISAEG